MSRAAIGADSHHEGIDTTYDGALLLVTHDRRMLTAVALDRTVTVEAGRLRE